MGEGWWSEEVVTSYAHHLQRGVSQGCGLHPPGLLPVLPNSKYEDLNVNVNSSMQ